MCMCAWWNQVIKNTKAGLTSVFENIKFFYCSMPILKVELCHSFSFLSDHNLLQGSYILSSPSVEKILIHTWSNWHIVGRRQNCLLPMCSLLWISTSVILLVLCMVQLPGTGKYRAASSLNWAALYSIEKARYSCDFYCEKRSLPLGETLEHGLLLVVKIMKQESW